MQQPPRQPDSSAEETLLRAPGPDAPASAPNPSGVEAPAPVSAAGVHDPLVPTSRLPLKWLVVIAVIVTLITIVVIAVLWFLARQPPLEPLTIPSGPSK